ncbi:MAG: histidinol-phosphate/aromatic aminotransferase/cobyric acid decarboxylase-like protein [Planctomycetota bacterium]|jgi:histidinol-phosphate/aromatic aminotransferase/cobyric acid decarboxylase-like protein
MYETDLDRERERLYSRLSTLNGIQPMPSIRNWVLVETSNPRELARRINRRIAPGTVSVPRHLTGAIRIPVRDPKSNELLFGIVRSLMIKRADEEAAREDAEAMGELDSTSEVG